jgi:hypothetical protein
VIGSTIGPRFGMLNVPVALSALNTVIVETKLFVADVTAAIGFGEDRLASCGVERHVYLQIIPMGSAPY